jgi:hypothetical protein
LAVFFLLVGGLFFSFCFGLIPPPHIPKPHVKVSYVGPKTSPDGKTTYLIKVVSQFSTRMYFSTSMLNSGWREVKYIVWSKCFLCRGEAAGQNPIVVSELPPEKFRWEDDFWFTGPVAFTVAWKQQKAVTVVNRLHDNVAFIDLQTGKCETYTISDSRPEVAGAMPFYGRFPCVYVEPIEGDSKLLWCLDDTVIGTLDFQGNVNVMDRPQDAELLAVRKDQSKAESYNKNAYSFSWPVWNDTQKIFAVEVTSRYNGISTVPHEIWVFNSKLELVKKSSFEDLRAVVQAKRQNKKPPEHKYAWVIDKLWETRKSSGYFKPADPADAASYYNSSTEAEPSPAEFQLKNHTIEHKKIDPEVAYIIW